MYTYQIYSFYAYKIEFFFSTVWGFEPPTKGSTYIPAPLGQTCPMINDMH